MSNILALNTYSRNSRSLRGTNMCEKVYKKPFIQDGKVLVELPLEISDFLKTVDNVEKNYYIKWVKADNVYVVKAEANLSGLVGMTDEKYQIYQNRKDKDDERIEIDLSD